MSIQVINLTPRRIAIDEEKYNSVVAFLNEGVPISSIISATKLSKASIYRIKDELLYSGRREFKKRGRKVKNASEQITQIKSLLRENPTLTAAEVRDKGGFLCTPRTIANNIKKARFSRKIIKKQNAKKTNSTNLRRQLTFFETIYHVPIEKWFTLMRQVSTGI